MSQFDREDTLAKVVAIVADKLSIDKNVIQQDSTLQKLGADSLDVVEIIMKLEDQFDIEIDDEKAEKLKNINDVVEYVQELRKK